MAGITTTHPLYDKYSPDWEQMYDTNEGSKRVKSVALRSWGEKYLLATEDQIRLGMANENQEGFIDYKRYLNGAIFHSIVSQAIERYIGIMHQQPPVFNLPPALEPLIKVATTENESMKALLRNINHYQLLYGRCGVLADFPANATNNQVSPYLSLYSAPNIINWSSDFIVLTEEYSVIENFEHKPRVRYRLLQLIDGVYYTAIIEDSTNDIESLLYNPTTMGRSASELPFSFINANDIVPDPQKPPYIDLSDLSLRIFSREADYELNTHVVGKHTIITSGTKLGSNATPVVSETSSVAKNVGVGKPKEIIISNTKGINMPEPNAKAYYIEPNPNSVEIQRKGLEFILDEASELAGSLISGESSETESGEARRLRLGAATTSIHSIALTGALGLEETLKKLGRWMGLSESDIEGTPNGDNPGIQVLPNTDFTFRSLSTTDLRILVEAKEAGAPISDEMINKYMREHNFTDLDLDAVYEQIADENQKKEQAGITEPAPIEDNQQENNEEN